MKKSIKSLCLICLCAIIVLIGVGCSSSQNGFKNQSLDSSNYSNSQSKSTSNTVALNSGIVTTEDRLLVYYVTINVTVENIETASSALKLEVKELEGYEQSSNYSDSSSAFYVFRIPTISLEDFIKKVDDYGTITRQVTNTEDLTDKYDAAKIKLESLKTYKESLEALLEQATSIEDIRAINKDIYEVASQIDSYEKTLFDYKKNSDYSTVTINLYTKTQLPIVTLLEKIKNTFGNSANSIKTLFEFLVLSVVAISPYIVLIGSLFAVYVIIKLIICKIKKVPFVLFKKSPKKTKKDTTQI